MRLFGSNGMRRVSLSLVRRSRTKGGSLAGTVELFLDGKAVGSRSSRVETNDPGAQYTFPNTTPKR